MRPAWHLLGALLVTLSSPGIADAQETESLDAGPVVLQTIRLPGPPADLVFGDAPLDLRRLKIRLADRQWLRLVECAGELCAEAARRGPAEPRLPEDGAPGTRLTKGADPFVEVWLADGTDRGGSGALPGPLAGALAARDRAGRLHRLDLTLDQAFEDVEPRLADLTGDGQDEIVVAKTRAGEGTALAVLTLREDGLVVLAESEPAPAGVWRDPIAIADLDGDGGREIATATSGDGIGRLEIWRLADGVLARVIQLKGFSSHLPGTRSTGLATVADMDGDKIIDLVLPALDRMSLRVISLAGGQAAEPYRINLPAEVVTRIGTYEIKGRDRPVIVTGLADGTLVLAR